MSLTTTIKRLEGEVKELQAMVDRLNGEADAARTAHEKAISEVKDAHASDLGRLTEKLNAKENELSQVTTKLTDTESSLQGATAERDQIKDQLQSAEEKLKNPAFKHASSTGQDPVVDAPDNPAAEGESLIKQYKAITDPKKKREFWTANEKGIQEEMAAASEK